MICPKAWKLANVIPIYKKKGSRSTVTNYRPISLTCIACRVLERLIRNVMYQHMYDNNLLSIYQHGFVSKRGTLTQLLEAQNQIINALDHKKFVDQIFLDFSKAFDTVSHPKLITKLKQYGFSGKIFGWLKSFLTDRFQRVIIDDVTSSWKNVKSGVPQGSVLGPLLFIIYVNDITDHISIDSAKLYADDVKLLKCMLSQDECAVLQNDLNCVSEWSASWQLSLQPAKCKVMHFGYRNPKNQYYLDHQVLPSTKTEKDLGVLFSSDLKFSEYCHQIANSSSAKGRLLQTCFVNKDIDFAVSLFNSYVRPGIEYNCPVWSPYLVSNIDIIESVQRRYTKRITGLYGLPYKERLKRCNLELLEYRRLKFDLITAYKIIHGKFNVPLNNYFYFGTYSRTRVHSQKLFPQYCRTNLALNCFSKRVVRMWNKLPESVVKCRSLDCFKKKLNSHPRVKIVLSKFLRGRASKE
jgi:hypothetical protein